MALTRNITIMDGEWTVEGVIRQIIEKGVKDEPFYVMDLGEIVKRYQCWKKLMPRVKPFYAVKCNNDDVLIRTLAALGAGFDCASRAEIDLITGIGVPPERIIYANPNKMKSYIGHATRVGVTVATFDSSDELDKIKRVTPHMKLVLRIRCDGKNVHVPLGIKFGCDPITEAPLLLKKASEQGLEVIGVSFHVGSGLVEKEAYTRALRHSANLFEIGKAIGFEMRLVDIGGGFPGYIESTIDEISKVVNRALDIYFPDNSVQVIAEPGLYFGCAAYTLAAIVIGKRQIANNGQLHTMYFLSDGVFGSFVNFALCNIEPKPLLLTPNNGRLESSSLWGPTCHSIDCIIPSTRLPQLQAGDWLYFQNMGAYTRSMTTEFHGFPKAELHVVVDRSIWSSVVDLKLFPTTDYECKSLTSNYNSKL